MPNMQVLCPYYVNDYMKECCIDRCVVLSLIQIWVQLIDSKTIIDWAFMSYIFTAISLSIKIWLSNK